MTLCSNRPDGPIDYFHTPAPNQVTVLSTCAIDVVLEPLGPILFILFAAVLATQRTARKPHLYDNGEVSYRHRPRRWLLGITTFLLVALAAMHAIEVARLAVNARGVGLLPLVFVPLVLVCVSLYVRVAAWSAAHAVRAVPHVRLWIAGVVCWAVWMAVANGVKVSSIVATRQALGTQAYDGADSRYKASDQITDDIVICALYIVVLLMFPFLR